MTDYDALLLRVEHQDAEIERLRAQLKNWDLIEKRNFERNATIEECARVADFYDKRAGQQIRALKDKQP